jgi:hypothetical protein
MRNCLTDHAEGAPGAYGERKKGKKSDAAFLDDLRIREMPIALAYSAANLNRIQGKSRKTNMMSMLAAGIFLATRDWMRVISARPGESAFRSGSA